MTHSTKHLIIGAAIAGLLSGSAARIQASTDQPATGKAAVQSSLADTDKHSCKGKNDCKGQGGCKAGDNGCKGQNTCKGKGGCATDGSKS